MRFWFYSTELLDQCDIKKKKKGEKKNQRWPLAFKETNLNAWEVKNEHFLNLISIHF